jgi:hypothetical protein
MEWRLLTCDCAVTTVEPLANLVHRTTRRVVTAVWFVAAAAMAAGCETSSEVSSGPTPVKCQVTVAAPGMLEAAGGNSAITVSALPECAWTASTSAGWITGLSPTTGQGNGSVSFRVAANDGSSAREGIIVVNDERARVSQRAPCRYTLSPVTQTIATSGGASSVTVGTSDPDCAWTATTDQGWIALSPTSGTGTGEINITVPPNPGPERTAAIIVAGTRATLTQSASAPSCNASISPGSQSFPAAGGSGSISVQTQGACDWNASSNAPWITVTSPTGRGSGVVAFTVAANTGAARTGTISVANGTFTVSQAAGAGTPPACTYSISPTSQNAGAAAGTGTLNVTTTAACAWTAVSNATWLSVTAGATGTGNGTVGFSIAANTGAARSGTLTIANQTFTVNQSAFVAPCTYSISPTSQSVVAGASTTTVTVTTTAACTWTASSGVPWITVASGGSGTGNGSVGLSIAANTGVARTGTVTIADQAFTVNQAAFVAPCTYAISPTSQNVAAGASTTTVTVTTAASCAWTTNSGAPWIAVTAGASGTGSGSVGLSIAANTDGARTGTVTIAGQTFTVNQAAVAAPCTYAISPTSQTMPVLGGTGTVTVTTTSACAWTATSNAPWLTITSGASGTGNGTVGFSAAVNVAGSRSGTLTIAGQTFTVTQDASIGPLVR